MMLVLGTVLSLKLERYYLLGLNTNVEITSLEYKEVQTNRHRRTLS